MVELLTCGFKTICVICSLNLGKEKEYMKAVCDLGRTLAAQKIDLIYGRDSVGLRDYVVLTASVGGSKVLGIILKALAENRHILWIFYR